MGAGVVSRSTTRTFVSPPRDVTALASGGFNGVLGLRIVAATADEVVGEFTATDTHLTSNGRVHGGALMAVADALGAIGTVLNLPRGTTTATIESKTNFLRGALPGPIRGEAVPLHIGRTTMVWQTTLFDVSGARIAIVTQTQFVMALDTARDEERAVAPEASSPPPAAAAPSAEPRSTRERLLQTAADMFVRKGFANTSMREIATACSVSVSSIYQYVESKDDLLALVFDWYIAAIMEGVTEASSLRSEPSERLRAAILANLERFDRFRLLINLMNRETKSLKPQARKRVLEQMRGYIEIFRGLVAEGVATGAFRRSDPELTANMILMLCEMWPLRHWAVGRFGLEAVREAVADLVLEGVQQKRGAR